ncbi:MAG: hypothetical protein [Wendovervirus sonii]|uniref:Uncharacterized protein n=1 Tax=phage Lak_Megaphage_Sonny TaxID=3109229 RepID=A0ABZ0Z246_9CAUD|nr:MAG: hypothetical protein [phage Lak_Megaphage_Sonny]
MDKNQLYESIMKNVSREVKKALNKEFKCDTKSVYFDIECK